MTFGFDQIFVRYISTRVITVSRGWRVSHRWYTKGPAKNPWLVPFNACIYKQKYTLYFHKLWKLIRAPAPPPWIRLWNLSLCQLPELFLTLYRLPEFLMSLYQLPEFFCQCISYPSFYCSFISYLIFLFICILNSYEFRTKIIKVGIHHFKQYYNWG